MRRRGIALALALAVVSVVIAGQTLAAKRTHTVTITSGPQGTVATTDASFSYSSSQRATFTCSLEGGAAVACGSGLTGSKGYSGLAKGGHTFLVTATVSSRDVAQARRLWTIAVQAPNQPPSASFTYSPSAPKAGEQVVFTSTSSDPDGSLSKSEWDLDGDNVFGEEGEPAGPTAAKSFPSAGSYTVRLRVTDNAGTQAVVTQTLAVAIPPTPAGAARVPMTFRKGRPHGPFVLTADALRRVADDTRDPEDEGEDEDEEPDDQDDLYAPAPLAGPCKQAVCGTLDLHEAAKNFKLMSPPLTTPAFGIGSGIDPQIAASSGGYLVAGLRNLVQFYDKSGQPLTEKCSSLPEASCLDPEPMGAVQLCDLFAPMLPAVNASIPLPKQKKDGFGNFITPKNGYGINCDKKTGGTRPRNWTWDKDGDKAITDADFYWPTNEIYDARVIWDDYHKRFWIAALMMNNNTAYKDDGRPSSKSDDVAHARRAFLAIAASKTEDPRDGWYLYWTEGFPQQAKTSYCPDECKLDGKVVNGGSDYLQIGISSKYLVLVGGGGFSDVLSKFTESTQHITVIPTDLLQTSATKLLFLYQTSDPIKNPDGSTIGVNAKIPAAVQHRPDILGHKLLLTTEWVDPGREESDPAKYNVLLWTLSLDSSTPTLYRQPIPVRAFRGFKKEDGAPQKGSTNKLGVAQNWINMLVYRKANLYLTFDECARQKEGNCLLGALRFLRVHLNGSVKSKGTLTWNLQVAVDRTFGRRNVLDRPGKEAWYGFPSVEVNKDGDAALAYDRSAAWLFPQARYSVYFLKEKDIRPSRVLKLGKSAITGGPLWHHYLGMSVDGFDDTGIWMINGYASNGRWRYAIGKVLGKTFADLEPAEVHVNSVPGGGQYKISVKIGNLGDDDAKPTHARLFLTRKKTGAADSAIFLKSIDVSKVTSGHSTTVAATVDIPARARAGYRYVRVSLDSGETLKEYGEQNNTAYARLR